jgi:RNA polymerase-binding transcription factor DksA
VTAALDAGPCKIHDDRKSKPRQFTVTVAVGASFVDCCKHERIAGLTVRVNVAFVAAAAATNRDSLTRWRIPRIWSQMPINRSVLGRFDSSDSAIEKGSAQSYMCLPSCDVALTLPAHHMIFVHKDNQLDDQKSEDYEAWRISSQSTSVPGGYEDQFDPRNRVGTPGWAGSRQSWLHGHIGSACQEYEREISSMFSERDRLKIRLIDDALKRIGQAGYGVCETCGLEISEKRLEAMPFTQLCRDCQQDQEREAKTRRRDGKRQDQYSMPGSTKAYEENNQDRNLVVKSPVAED